MLPFCIKFLIAVHVLPVLEFQISIRLIFNYRIAGKFGEDLNLAIWRFWEGSPN